MESLSTAPRAVLAAALALWLAVPAGARKPDVLRPTASVPPHLAGRFREAVDFQQSASGQYFVFDRRGHAVYGLDPAMNSVWNIVEIGAEPGRILEPTAFSVAADGTFVVADAPLNNQRIQVFTPAGFRTGGFFLPGRARARVTIGRFVLNGIGTLEYTGRAILVNQPDTGALITEYTLSGRSARSIGSLRATGHEDDRDLHLALNTGIPLAAPDGGFYFVFQAGEPVFRKYDRAGRLEFERRIQGREIDETVAMLPTAWPRRRTADGELPVVAPTVRTAAVDREGKLWVSFVVPDTYVFDADGDKVRSIQFQAAGLVAPNSLSFGINDHVLVTPGLSIFDGATAPP